MIRLEMSRELESLIGEISPQEKKRNQELKERVHFLRQYLDAGALLCDDLSFINREA